MRVPFVPDRSLRSPLTPENTSIIEHAAIIECCIQKLSEEKSEIPPVIPAGECVTVLQSERDAKQGGQLRSAGAWELDPRGRESASVLLLISFVSPPSRISASAALLLITMMLMRRLMGL